MSIAIYARVSAARQEEEQTIASQLDQLRQFVSERGWGLDEKHAYSDDGVSGARLDRPGLDALRDAAAEGQIDRVVITCPDRLARSYPHQWVICEELKKHGCEVVFINRPISGTPEDQLLLHMQGAIAEYERAKILERTRRGRLYRARTGEMVGWGYAPFGYRYVRHEQKGGHVEVDDAEAHWVRQMHRWLQHEGSSLRAIANRLQDARVRCRAARFWNDSSVRLILSSTVYVGRAYYNRRCTVHERVEQGPGRAIVERRRVRLRPREDWIEIRVPAILDEETFRRSQERLKQNAAFSKRRSEPGRYLLRGLIRCGKCGYAMSGFRNQQYSYYRCNHATDPREAPWVAKCEQKSVRTDLLDEYVWQHVGELLTNPGVLEEQLALRRAEPAEAKQATSDTAHVEREIQAQKRRLERLLDLYEDGALEKPVYLERQSALQLRVEGLEKEREQLERRKREDLQHARLLSGIDHFRSVIAKGTANAAFEDRQRICRWVIESVDVLEDEVIVKHILPMPAIVAQ